MENQNVKISQTSMAISMEQGPPITTAPEQPTTKTDTIPNVTGTAGSEQPKKKRGRPRTASLKVPSHSINSFEQKQQRNPRETEELHISALMGGFPADIDGGNFNPYVVMVYPGQDVLEKITTLFEGGHQGFFILSANGILCSAAIRHLNCVMNYKGRLEIISLRGSLVFKGTSSSNCRSRELTLTVAEPIGKKVFGGTVEGPMIAAGVTQMVVGAFKPNIKSKIERNSAQSPTTFRKISGKSPYATRHCSAESSGTASRMHGNEDLREISLQFSKILKQEERGSEPTTDGVLPVNAIPENENKQSTPLNGVAGDNQ